jgi:hypothetical protein
MKRLFIPLGLIAVMAVPGTAIGAPSKADKREGKRECRQLRDAAVTRANFVQIVKLEAKANRRNAFGRCVEVRTSDATSERREAFKAAKAACESLRRGPDGPHGKPSDPGVYGKCVAEAAHKNGAESDAEQREESLNPAKTCRNKQREDSDAFKAEFPGSNGFGKCVSKEAKAKHDQGE